MALPNVRCKEMVLKHASKALSLLLVLLALSLAVFAAKELYIYPAQG